MQLNEIIEENTLPSISRKTRISVQNLEALLARDWERLKKVQALGFISILEREYHLDLSDMRSECRTYFEAHEPAEEEKGPMITAAPEPEHRGPSGGMVVLVIFLAALGGYLLFFSPADTGEEANTTSVERKSGFFGSVLTTAQSWFGKGEQKTDSESEASAEEVPAVKGAWAESNESRLQKKNEEEEKASEEEKEVSGSESSPEESPRKEQGRNSPETEEARIIQQVKKEQAKAEEIRKQAAEEEGGSTPASEEEKPLSDISKMILAATAGAAAPAEEAAEARPSSSGSEGEKGQATPIAEEKTSSAEAKQSGNVSPKPATEKTRAVTDTLVIMHPRSKIWVGYTNLRNMKRTAKVTTEDVTFDTATGDYILAVGHGMIDFKTAGGEKKLNDGTRHFFMIAKGGVREISHEEFQRLNKSKVW